MDHYGYWSLLPPLLAIGLAMATRRVLPSLLAGVFCGALVLAHGNPITAAVMTAEDLLWQQLVDSGNLRVFAFTLLMGAMVGVIHRSGGMLGLVEVIRPLASSRRRGQLAGWLLGLVIFFDDYANTLLLGSTFKPVTDRLRVSREKLAYIVDSTAAPIAGIALLSTWVAAEVGYIRQGFDQLGVTEGSDGAFGIFVETIAYRFYPLLALLMVGLVAATRRDFGPMLRAERRAIDGRTATGYDERIEESAALRPDFAKPHLWHLAVFPVLVVIAAVMGLLYKTGVDALPADAVAGATLWQIVGAGDSSLALMYGSLAGLVVATVLTWLHGQASLAGIRAAAGVGAQMMLPALAVLWMAWSLADVVSSPTEPDANRLGAGAFISQQIGDALPVEWMPTIVFVLASFVAFCTGTSWGTMGILTALVIQTTWKMLGPGATINDPVLLGVIGSVLGGAIFGDHCSPISDTTVLSSRASGCEHMAHVWTQLPYALLVGVVSILCGTIPVGFGAPLWLLLPAAAVVLLVLLLMIGRRAEEHT